MCQLALGRVSILQALGPVQDLPPGSAPIWQLMLGAAISSQRGVGHSLTGIPRKISWRPASGSSRNAYYQVDLEQILSRTVLFLAGSGQILGSSRGNTMKVSWRLTVGSSENEKSLCAWFKTLCFFYGPGSSWKTTIAKNRNHFIYVPRPQNFNVELGWVPNQVVMKNDHLCWTPFRFKLNIEIGGAGVVTSSHASIPRWSFFMISDQRCEVVTNVQRLVTNQHCMLCGRSCLFSTFMYDFPDEHRREP